MVLRIKRSELDDDGVSPVIVGSIIEIENPTFFQVIDLNSK